MIAGLVIFSEFIKQYIFRYSYPFIKNLGGEAVQVKVNDKLL
jgi:hypothetical protein